MVSSGLMKIVPPCWRAPAEGGNSRNVEGNGRSDGFPWHKDLGHHMGGEFSMAVIQANNVVEDKSQIESGPLSSLDRGPCGTYVGIYDGHGGPEAACYVNEHLFQHLNNFISEYRDISVDVILKAFSATEEGFISLVRKEWRKKPHIASVGTCVLVGILCGGILYIANLGDSRVVLGTVQRGLKEVSHVQLSSEHNVGNESVRQELQELHPHDSQIVVLKHKAWRVKGIIQVSRSIGDAYLKDVEFNKEPLIPRFRLPEPFMKPVLSAEPSVTVRKLCPGDQFLIFGSDGLWEHLSNQDAVDIVHQNPHNGIARRLIKVALHEAAKKREMRYSDLKKIDRGVRRHFHDDITVIVLFIDHQLVTQNSHRPALSLKAG